MRKRRGKGRQRKEEEEEEKKQEIERGGGRKFGKRAQRKETKGEIEQERRKGEETYREEKVDVGAFGSIVRARDKGVRDT